MTTFVKDTDALMVGRRKPCLKAMPLLKPDTRVEITYKGERVCGFVSPVHGMEKPPSRYIVVALVPGTSLATAQELTDAMVRQVMFGIKPGEPLAQVWDYVYVRRDDLEAAVLGQASGTVQ